METPKVDPTNEEAVEKEEKNPIPIGAETGATAATAAESSNGDVKSHLRRQSKIPGGITRTSLNNLNPHLTCELCSGYFIDAITIVECVHSFCRACLLRFLETTPNCPKCELPVNKTQLHKSIRSDQTLQDLVYKLVPGLYKNELRRRKDFYMSYFKKLNDDPGTSKALAAHSRSNVQIFDKHLVELSALIYTPDELISLSLEYSNAACPPSTESSKPTASQSTSRRKRPPKKRKSNETEMKELALRKRYFRCPAAVTIAHLKKLLSYKLELPPTHQMEVLHSDEPLDDEYTLMDVAYIYTWRRKAPMQLFFNVFTYEEADDDDDVSNMPQLEAEVEPSSLEADVESVPPKLVKLENDRGEEEACATSLLELKSKSAEVKQKSIVTEVVKPARSLLSAQRSMMPPPLSPAPLLAAKNCFATPAPPALPADNKAKFLQAVATITAAAELQPPPISAVPQPPQQRPPVTASMRSFSVANLCISTSS